MNTEFVSHPISSIKDKYAELSPETEGKLTKTVEKQTAKAPSMVWLGAAVGSMALSAGLQLFTEKKELSNFIGTWAPCFLMIGIYNKMVKTHGSDQHEHDGAKLSSIH